MSDDCIHMNIRISGSVQGVGFRYAAMHTALRMGITGYVRNLPVGDVYIEAEGSRKNLKEFISWCNEGPPHAWVKCVEIHEDEWQDFTEFRIFT